jgi:hypothetical protein
VVNLGAVKEKLTDVATRGLLNLASQYAVDEAVSKIVDFLNSVTPEQVYDYSLKGLTIFDVDPTILEEWRKTLRGYALGFKKYGQTQRVIELVNMITPQRVVEEVVKKANATRSKRCLENLSLVVNVPQVGKWFAGNVEKAKTFIIETISSV